MLNKNAQKFVDKCFYKLPIKILPKDMYLYHGARSTKEISAMRSNAMFSPRLSIGINYAFQRDKLNYDLNRALFCCRLKADTKVIVIKRINWLKFHQLLYKYDNNQPQNDHWLQNSLLDHIKSVYGKDISGVVMEHTREYIFDHASKRLNVHKVIY